MLTIYLFREDLRLDDNPGLARAAQEGPVLPVFVLDDGTLGDDTSDPQRLGSASRWWLHHSLSALNDALRTRGSRLTVLKGDTVDTIVELVNTTGAGAVHLSRGYAPWGIALETRLNNALTAEGCTLRRFGGRLLFEPEEVATRGGAPFKVFTPFWRRCLELNQPAGHTPAPERIEPPESWPEGLVLDALGLMPSAPDWSGGLQETWQPGEAGALDRLQQFVECAADGYQKNRDIPSIVGTSRLSPHLRWGEISPRLVWQTAKRPDTNLRGGDAYLRELGWRDFSHHLLFHFPRLPTAPLREPFAAISWRNATDDLQRWQRGRTGYPIVDAGMRELWHTGWMHNRVRMVAASFLVKHLLVDWRLGAAWFMDTLVDADPANNSAGWQWVAGCGTDAAPYFRVFNPTLQGEKFDTDGAYVRQWVPELRAIDGKILHEPWKLPPEKAPDYPDPMIDHKAARTRALDAFGVVKSSG